MRGPTQGVRTLAWREYKASKPSQSGILLLSELSEDRLSLWPIVRPMTHSYSSGNLKKVPEISRKWEPLVCFSKLHLLVCKPILN